MKRSLIGLALGGLLLGAAALGAVTLPNGWRIAAPPATVTAVGTLPTGLALSRDGRRAYVLEAGHRQPALRILDAHTLADLTTIPLPNAFGGLLRDAGGDGLWIANTSTFGDAIAHLDPASGRFDDTISLPMPFVPAAIAAAPGGRLLAVAGDLAGTVAFVDRARHAVVATVPAGRHPAALVFTADGRTLYVAARGERLVSAIDVATRRVRARIAVGLHPAALALAGTRLYVADSDDDDITAIDTTTDRVVARAPLPFVRNGIVGASPNGLAVDGDRLYVTCGAANALAVYRIAGGTLEPLGALPTGWYPTAVAIDRAGGALLVADGKGERGHPNPLYRTSGGQRDYVADNTVGSIRRLPLPTDAELRAGLAAVRSLGAPYGAATPPPDPIVRAGGPIRHVIYIVKENRTYDQVLGDVAGADGDPSLVLYGRAVTPNQHALVARFGVFDRFFCDAQVSADGHNWSLAAFANDYLEKTWPPLYANRRSFYDYEDGAGASTPHAGYLWDAAARAHVTLRDYGEYVTAGPNDDGTPVATTHAGLAGKIDLRFATFDLHIADAVRFVEWKREFDAYERTHTLPALEIVRFARDHTAGTKPGEATPEAMVADNDLAVGKLVEAVSHSADWASTAIFIVEDDAQNGPDHVDGQRSTLYLASPYAAGGLQHAHYSTSSVLRTIELLLGIAPMSPYDAGARPLSAAFTTTPNLAPFDALPAQVDLDAKNGRTAYHAAESARLDFAHADAVDPELLNDILVHAARER